MRGDYLRRVLAEGICPKCHEPKSDIDEQYSYGVYAGVFCVDCARRCYRDACGHRREGQGDPRELIEMGENYDEEDGGFYGGDDDAA